MDKSDAKTNPHVETNLEKAKHSATEVLNTLKDKAHDFQEKAAHFQEETASFAKDKYAKVSEKSAAAREKVTTYTKENPLKAIGIAAVAGAVIAKLFSSRK